MFADLLDAFADLKLPAVRWTILGCIAVSLVVLLLMPWGASVLLGGVSLVGWGWLDGIIDVTGTIIAAVLAILLFPIVMTAITGLVAEFMLDPMERVRHPDLPPLRDLPLTTAIGNALVFLLIALLLTLLVLVGGFFLVGLNVLLAWSVNAYLLSREFIDVVALRRLPPQEIKAWRKRNRLAVFLRGLILAALFVIPVLNLIAPILAALMTSHWLARTDIYADTVPTRAVH